MEARQSTNSTHSWTPGSGKGHRRAPAVGVVVRWMVVAMLGLFAAEVAQALTFVVQGGQASPGDTPDVCVALPDNDGTVAGFQMDLVWDSSCLSVDQASTNEGACFANPEARRAMFRTSLRGNNGLRILALNLTDTSPIPAGVRDLFCCQFRVAPAAGGRTCAISVSEAIASDPKGNRLPNVRSVPGAIAVRGGAEERGARAPFAGPGAVMMPPVVEGGAAPRQAEGGSGSAPAPAPRASGGGVSTAPVQGVAKPVAPAGVSAEPHAPEAPPVALVPAEPVRPEGIPAMAAEGGATPEATPQGEEPLGTSVTTGTPGRTPSPIATPPAAPTPQAQPTGGATPAGSPKPRENESPQGTPTPALRRTPGSVAPGAGGNPVGEPGKEKPLGHEKK